MKKLWFKRRRYGYGWVPVSKEGWSVVLIFLLAIFATSYLLLKDVPEDTYQAEVGYFLGAVLIYAAIAIYISAKHGPKPKWRWGKADEDNPDEDF